MRTYFITSILSGLLLAACGNSSDTAETPAPNATIPVDTKPIASSDTVNVAIVPTSQLDTPERIIAASIAPEPGISAWSSHILLLGQSGQLFAGNTGFGKVQKLADGPYKDVLGLSMGFEPPVFLTRTEYGTVTAFQDSGEDGFKAIEINNPEELYGTFCGSYPVTPDVFALVIDDTIETVLYSVDETGLSLKSGGAAPDQSLDCKTQFSLETFSAATADKPFDPSSVFDDDYQDNSRSQYQLSLSDGVLSYNKGDKRVSLKVEHGLSLMGMENPAWIYATSSPLGNTFNKGALLLGSSTENRVVMVSMEYLLKQVDQ